MITEVKQCWTRLVLGWETSFQVASVYWWLVVGSVLMQSWQLGSVGWRCTEPTVVWTTLGTGPAEDVITGLEFPVDLPGCDPSWLSGIEKTFPVCISKTKWQFSNWFDGQNTQNEHFVVSLFVVLRASFISGIFSDRSIDWTSTTTTTTTTTAAGNLTESQNCVRRFLNWFIILHRGLNNSFQVVGCKVVVVKVVSSEVWRFRFFGVRKKPNCVEFNTFYDGALSSVEVIREKCIFFAIFERRFLWKNWGFGEDILI